MEPPSGLPLPSFPGKRGHEEMSGDPGSGTPAKRRRVGEDSEDSAMTDVVRPTDAKVGSVRAQHLSSSSSSSAASPRTPIRARRRNIHTSPPSTNRCIRGPGRGSIHIQGITSGIDPLSGKLFESSGLQREHAEAKKLLEGKAQESTEQILNSPGSLIDGLKIFKKFPRREGLKAFVKDLSLTILGALGRDPSSDVIQALSSPGINWDLVKAAIEPLFTEESVAEIITAYHDHFISRDENLWWLAAGENAKKGDKEFLTWLKEVITDRRGEKSIRHSDRMLHYLHYWHSLHKGEQALSWSNFSDAFIRQCAEQQDPFGQGGVLEGLVQAPPNQTFRKICVEKGSYTFAESINVWLMKTQASDIRAMHRIHIASERIAEVFTCISAHIRSSTNSEEIDRLKAIQNTVISQLDERSNQITRETVDAVRLINPQLSEELRQLCETAVLFMSPSGTEKSTPLARIRRPEERS